MTIKSYPAFLPKIYIKNIGGNCEAIGYDFYQPLYPNVIFLFFAT